MQNFKDYMGKHFKGKRLHLTCDCLFPIDIKGSCVDYSISSNELILHMDVDGKIVKIGENHPKLKIEVL